MNPEPAHTAEQNQQETLADQPYTHGRPASTYLPFRVMVRLTILRSKLSETDSVGGYASCRRLRLGLAVD
jgi:hypothetical protein